MDNSKFITINNNKIHYIEKGQGENTILFLHGLPISSYVWRNIIPTLSSKAMCIAPDLIGMGRSDKPSKYGAVEHLRDIKIFIEKLQLTNITLVLHGFGSFIGFNYAMNNPNNIKGIAFYEPHLCPFNNTDKQSLPIQELIYLFQQKPNYSYKKIVEDNFLINKLLPSMVIRKLDDDVQKLYQTPFINLEDRKTIWHLFEDFYLNNDSTNKINEYIINYSSFLQKSSIPKLLLYNIPGFNTSMAMIKWCKNNLPNIKLADLEEGIHLAPETNPRLFSAILLDWYNKIL